MTKEEFRDAINKIILAAKTVEEKKKKFDDLYEAVRNDVLEEVADDFDSRALKYINYNGGDENNEGTKASEWAAKCIRSLKSDNSKGE